MHCHCILIIMSVVAALSHVDRMLNDPEEMSSPTNKKQEQLIDKGKILLLKDIDHLSLKIVKLMWLFINIDVLSCRNVLVTENTETYLIRRFIEYSYLSSKPLVIVNLQNFKVDDNDLLKNLWGYSTCRTLFIDRTIIKRKDTFRILESSRLWLWNNVKVVIVGGVQNDHLSLLQHAFRNIPRPLYLVLGEQTIQQLKRETFGTIAEKEVQNQVQVFRRCLFCSDGQPQVRFLTLWHLDTEEVPHGVDLFPGPEKNLHQYQMRVTTMEHFPYSYYDQINDDHTVIFGDCFDGGMLNIFSAQMNFSYEVRIPEDGEWGMWSPTGNWTGMIGKIQYEQADMTTVTSPNRGRSRIVDFARFYASEIMDIVSLKPEVIPRYLVIIKPFTEDVWLYLVLSIMIWGGVFWLLQEIWSRFTGRKIRNLGESIFYSWAVILEDPPQKTPTNLSGQISVGFWLLACLILTTGYKTGLMVNLAIESKMPPIESFHDLVERKDWQYSMLQSFFFANEMTYLKENPDPTVQMIGKHIQGVADTSEGLEKVLRGGFSFIHTQNEVRTEIESYHTDSTGMSPFYLSKNGHKMTADYGWSLRKGLPYGDQLKFLMNRMIETGITNYLIQRIVRSRIAQNRKSRERRQKRLENDNEIVLRMSHLLGVFLFLFFGFGVSLSTLVMEMMIHKFYGFNEDKKSCANVVAMMDS